jgi:hypothetical protein
MIQQPTSFRLDTYELSNVFATPDLITSLARYVEDHRTDSIKIQDQGLRKSSMQTQRDLSVLFLRISVAADYFTTDKSRMKNVPPVFVDIILDPYFFNVLPQSLVPTASYITALAIGSWFLARHISVWFQESSILDVKPAKKHS